MQFLRSLILIACTTTMIRAADDFPPPINNQKGEHVLTSPADAQKQWNLPPGFEISLFAHEPEVRQPIALTTDARGRLWVAECYSYDDRNINYSADQRDRVVIYEDTDHDGRHDKRTVFWDQAWKLTSVEVGFGGVWVLCAPNLLFIPDRNGDDIPDGEPEVVLAGWDDDRIRHNIVNGLKWGPDGWLYGRHGIMAISQVGTPDTPKARRTLVNTSIWRFHPTRKAFEVVCHGGTNPWGHDWNEYGELIWINTVIGHLWHGIPGGYFKRMYGEHMRPNLYEYIDQHADHFHWDTKLAWNKARDATGLTDTVGGGHAHCGMMIYLGDNWPKKYQGELFTVNLLGHRLNQDHLERKGTGYVGRHRPDFAHAGDKWFRGIDLIYGNDGGVFIADWSDVGECHENDGIHRTSGRIWKISAGKPKPPAVKDVAKLSGSELVGLQAHANEWYARQARKILQERVVAGQDMTAVHAAFMQDFLSQKHQVRKLRALWGLYVTGGTSVAWLREQLGHPLEHIRVWAVRLLTQEGAVDGRTRQRLEQIAATEQSGLVRLYLASALQRIPVPERIQLAQALLGRSEDRGDHNQELMVWYGIEEIAAEQPQLVLPLIRNSRLPIPRKWASRRIIEQIGEQPSPAERLVGLLTKVPDAVRRDILTGMQAGLKGWRSAPKPTNWDRVAAKLRSANDESIGKLAQDLDVVFGSGRALEELRKMAQDKSADPVSRRAALQVVIENQPADLGKILLRLVNDRETQIVAVRGLAAVNEKDAPNKILSRWRFLKPDDRIAAVSTLSSRPSYAKELLTAVGRGTIPRSEVKAFHARQIRSLGDPQLEELLRKHWGDVRTSSAEKKQLMARHRQRLTEKELGLADLGKGRKLYNLVCANCHTLFGEGKDIGPDITGANRNNLEYLLENIADPSAMIAGDFKMNVINLRNGQVINGAILRETTRTLEIQTATDKITVDVNDVGSRKSSTLSLMPDGLLEALSDEQVRDLFGYLMSPKQVPFPKN